MVMFTATMPQAVEALAQRYMRWPATVRIGDVDSGKNKKVEQHVLMVASEGKKAGHLAKLLRRSRPPVIVFANA